jgi:hypothetical protein
MKTLMNNSVQQELLANKVMSKMGKANLIPGNHKQRGQDTETSAQIQADNRGEGNVSLNQLGN